MGELIVLLVAVLVFCLLWYAIGLIAAALAKASPPPPFPIATILYLLLILGAVVWLWARYLGGA